MDLDDHLDLLSRFVLDECGGRAPSTQDRYRRVMGHLLDFTDAIDVARHLGTHDATLLDAERQFEPHGAFFNAFGFDELICCLPEFLEPHWLLAQPADRRAQIAMVDRLARWLSRERLIDRQRVSCAYWDVESAVGEARRWQAKRPLPGVAPRCPWP